MKNDNFARWILIIFIIIVLYKYSGFFAIISSSSAVQYTNAPVETRFNVNLTSPVITVFYNDVQVYTLMINETTNQTINGMDLTYQKDIINGTYILKLTNVKTAGIFKIVASQNNESYTQVIEVRNPFVDVKNDIPATIESGTKQTFTIQTFNPQGNTLDADSVDIDAIDPTNVKTNLILTKSINGTFTKDFTYPVAGNFVFKIHARKQGYETVEKTAITDVTKTFGVNPIIWIWTGIVLIWLIFFVIRRFRK